MWSSLWSILVYKIPQFWAKAMIQKAHHTSLEGRQPEVTKNLYHVLSSLGIQKKVSSHGLLDLIEEDSVCCFWDFFHAVESYSLIQGQVS